MYLKWICDVRNDIVLFQDLRDCLPCPEGYYCGTEGMADYGSSPCPPGFYCPEATWSPIPCPPGTLRYIEVEKDVTEQSLK